jgi:hypothetical protein
VCVCIALKLMLLNGNIVGLLIVLLINSGNYSPLLLAADGCDDGGCYDDGWMGFGWDFRSLKEFLLHFLIFKKIDATVDFKFY